MMEKKKFNLVGNSFTHLTGGNKGYSVHGKESKYIEWVQDGTGESTFYVDSSIPQALVDNDGKKKYAWLLESKYVTPQIVDAVKMFPEKYLETFDMIFTHNQELLKIDSKFKWVPANGFWIKDAKIYPKTKLISFITSNKNFTEGHNERLKWVKMIGDQVDLYGRGFNEIEFKEEALCDYMFSVVVENGNYESYFTEKILDCFATGTIPVYLGCPDIGNHFNSDGIIPLSEEFDISEDIYYNKLDAVKENLQRIREIEVLEDFIFKNYLDER
jgi:hypothetical protein